jgi:hypothetical protein
MQEYLRHACPCKAKAILHQLWYFEPPQVGNGLLGHICIEKSDLKMYYVQVENTFSKMFPHFIHLNSLNAHEIATINLPGKIILFKVSHRIGSKFIFNVFC